MSASAARTALTGSALVCAVVVGCSHRPSRAMASTGESSLPAPPLAPSGSGAGLPMVDVRAYGAKGDGATDDRAAITAALEAVARAGGGTVYVPPGVYVVGQDGTKPFSIDVPCSNCTLLGVAGKSWLKQPPKLPGSPVALLRIDDKADIKIADLGLDGNWGNKVGGVDSQDGINHKRQRDPMNHLIMLRGATDVTIEGVQLRQAYGDCIWMGFASRDPAKWTKHVRVVDTTCDMAARDGIALAQATSDVLVDHCQFTNIYAQAFDTEPVNQPVQDVTIEHSYLGAWWNAANPSRKGNIPLSIEGGSQNAGESLFARHYRVRDNVIVGGVMIASAADVVLAGNRIVANWDGHSYPPVMVRLFAEDVTISNNYIYTRTTPGVGDRGTAIALTFYAAGPNSWGPSNVRVTGNWIHARHGNSGIRVNGVGGPPTPSQSGKAARISEKELTDPSAHWRPNMWRGATVRSGNMTAVVRSNTADTLTLGAVSFGAKTAWMAPLGATGAAPTTGAYTLGWASGVIDIADNTIDLTDDGNGPGKHGIVVLAERAGARIRIHGNTIRNAVGEAIRVHPADRARPYALLELFDNVAFDDQPVHTTTATVGFAAPQFLGKLVMHGNVAGDGVPAAVSGLTSGTWMVEGDAAPRYAGYGAPDGVVAAPVGALYQRLDAHSGGSAMYVKTSGTGETGWVPLGSGR